MKRILGLLVLILAPWASAQKSADVKAEAASPAPRVLAAAAVASHYLNNRPSPPAVYIDCNGGLDAKEVLNFVRVKPASGVVKAGNNCETKGGKLVEKGTGTSCESFLLAPQEITGEKATFKVYWDGPNLEWTTSLAVLKLVKGKWEVVEDRVVLVP